jgi:tetratricopeptide (TPR) repeat protein
MRETPLVWQSPPARRAPHEKVLPLLRAAVRAAPDRPDLRLQLAIALRKTDRMAELVDWLRPVAEDPNAEPELLMCLGDAAISVGEWQLALAAQQSAAAKGFAPAFGRMAETLIRLRRPDHALAAGLEALDRLATDTEAFGIVAQLLLDRGETERLWNLCVRSRACGMWGSYVPSAMMLAAAPGHHDDELVALTDPARWFSSQRLAFPEDFNDRLAAELLAHPLMREVPRTRATEGATSWVLQLQLTGGPLAQTLLAKLREAVGTYVAERRAFADQPMIAGMPRRVDLNAWAVAVHHDGYQTWHLHDAWLSGVYYIQIPPAKVADNEIAGAIEFGLYPFGRGAETLRSPCWHVRPEPGMLVLFPSYFAHRTWPTGVGDPRVCVAFDVKAAETSAGLQHEAQSQARAAPTDPMASRLRAEVEIS